MWEEPWPTADPALLERDTFELVCQVNGKVRDRVAGAGRAPTRDELEALARAAPNVRAHVDGHEVVKAIVVPGKLVTSSSALSGAPRSASPIAVAGSARPTAAELARRRGARRACSPTPASSS